VVEESEYISLRSDARAGDKHGRQGKGRRPARGHGGPAGNYPARAIKRLSSNSSPGWADYSNRPLTLRTARAPLARGCTHSTSQGRRQGIAPDPPSSARCTTASACWPARCRDEGRGLHPSPSPAPNPLARSLVACVGMWAYLITHPLAQGAGSCC
jgi:hypothetical protein